MASFVTDRGGDGYGRVYALFNVAYSCGMLLGPWIAGFTYDLLGFLYLMVAFAVALFVIGLIMAIMVFQSSGSLERQGSRSGGYSQILHEEEEDVVFPSGSA